ncbi:MAG: hypothetical protein ACREXM_05500 [Gammaproteobacteria bacterium]
MSSFESATADDALAGSVCSSSQPTCPARSSSQAASRVPTRQRASTVRSLSSTTKASKMPPKLARSDGVTNEPSSKRWVSRGSVNSAAIVEVPPGSVACIAR